MTSAWSHPYSIPFGWVQGDSHKHTERNKPPTKESLMKVVLHSMDRNAGCDEPNGAIVAHRKSCFCAME